MATRYLMGYVLHLVIETADSYPFVDCMGVAEYRVTMPTLFTDRNQVSSRVMARIINNECHRKILESDIVITLYELIYLFRENYSDFSGQIPYIKPKNKYMSSDKLLVGLCWRSGLLSPARLDHYTEIEDWKPLLENKEVEIVNLQHDITHQEKEFLSGYDNFHKIEGVDIKDDVQGMADIAYSCDIVIAPQTALAEVAGAAGVKVLLVMPTMNGSWRKMNSGKDIWFESMEVVYPRVPGDKKELVDLVLRRI